MPPKGMAPVIWRACWAAGGIFRPVPVGRGSLMFTTNCLICCSSPGTNIKDRPSPPWPNTSTFTTFVLPSCFTFNIHISKLSHPPALFSAPTWHGHFWSPAPPVWSYLSLPQQTRRGYGHPTPSLNPSVSFAGTPHHCLTNFVRHHPHILLCLAHNFHVGWEPTFS